MSQSHASQLLSESYDRKLTDEENLILNNAFASDPELLEFKNLLDRLRQVHHADAELENDSLPFPQAHLSDDRKLEIESLIQSALDNETLQNRMSHEPTRQLREVAFANVAIENGAITHEQLAVVAKNWSAYGSVSLRDHMVSQSIITNEEAERLETLANETVMDLDGSETKIDVHTPSAFDSIAEVLGVAFNPLDGLANSTLTIAGNYTLIRKIGGGLGSVWLAKDNKLGRTVAIKTIPRSTDATNSTFQRFVREAIITSKLEHPNIVTIYQYGEETKTGNLFYAMRFLGKRTLQDVIQEFHQRKLDGVSTKADFQKLLFAFKTVCQAIGFAHSKGVVHRDLKPQNVAMDDFGQVSVLDWGLAKVHHDNELTDDMASAFGQSLGAENTLQGQVLGTPFYMAPEQAAGRVHQIDERTDVFGLGGILFEILTGKPPHFRPGLHGKPNRKIDEMLSDIVQGDSPMVADLVDDIDFGLAKICERAISKNRLSRYSSALELFDAVEDWIGGVADRIKIQETLKSVVCDLNTRFTGLVDDTKCNLRFLAVLPPVQGIMDAVAKRDNAEDVDVWIERFSVILESLIRTNSQILSASFFRFDEDECASEICAVSRHINDASFVKSVPKSRLLKLAEQEILDGIREADPDDVLFTLCTQFRNKKMKTGMALRGDVPIFDNGESFGFLSVKVEPANSLRHDYASKALDTMSTSVFDCSLRQIAGTSTKAQKETLAQVKQLVQTNDCIELESAGFYAQKIEIEDIPGRVLTAVVCASARSTDN